jgi:tetratricopeptide (TPR) repeat protein
MLARLLQLLGFRKGENMEICYERLERLSEESRDGIKDAYLRETLSDALERSAQEGLRLWRSGRRLQALEVYSRAIEASPENSILLLNRAQLQLELGNVNGALRDFDRARAGQPRLPDRVFVMQEHLQSMSPEALDLFIQRRRKNGQRTG